MRNKIILIAALLIMLIDLSSCRMREVGVYRNTNYFHPTHTRRHYARERHTNIRKMFWGRHRSGMRPYTHRGQIRY